MKTGRIKLIAYACAGVSAIIIRDTVITGAVLMWVSGFASALLWINSYVAEKEQE